MGFEFQINFEQVDPDVVDTWLRSHPFFHRVLDDLQTYEFRRPGEEDSRGMPALSVRIEPTGLYVCSYDSPRSVHEIAGLLLDKLERIEIVAL